MAGISSKALSFGQPENKKKYQSYEYNTDFDINFYESFYRSHDPQLGRFWQIDPKPNYGESVYASMSNNPILYNDLLGDTVKYANIEAQKLIQKFASPIIMKKGKEVTNKNYNKTFAKIIDRLNASTDNFVFNFDASAKEGSLSYDGSNVNITIGEPGDGYGTKVGAEGILFEETKHAEQVLDGKVYFQNSNGTWGVATGIYNEVEAKMFAADQLGVQRTYTITDPASGLTYESPTQLGYMKYHAKSDIERTNFLQHNTNGITAYGQNGRSATVNIPAAYPNLSLAPPINILTQRTKTDKIFGYPKQ